MRLLNVYTMEMEDFLGEEVPLHAILSHTWEKEEVTYQHLMASLDKLNPVGSDGNPRITEPASSMAGFKKLMKWCEKAKEEGFTWVWMDTCCIDKTSSAELSEAINSMFRWYRDADLCYAYLSDVDSESDPNGVFSEFRKSRWFTRGWTLQELIAPFELIFLGSDMKEIGTRRSLSKIVAEVTKIDERVLRHEAALESFSVARRLSWASQRRTTRIEDEAYCLLGLFDINMPLLYGEGQKAFFRLQKEIIDRSDDCSIFAWEMALDSYPVRDVDQPYTGLMAVSVKQFESCASMNEISAYGSDRGPVETEFLHRDIRVASSKQLIILNAPTILIVDKSTHGTPSKYSIPHLETMEFLDKHSTSYSRSSQPYRLLSSKTALRAAQLRMAYSTTSSLFYALVAQAPCWGCSQSESRRCTGDACPHHNYIGILLEKPRGGHFRRLHLPSLLEISFLLNESNAEERALAQRFLIMPLTKLSILSVWSQYKSTTIERNKVLLSAPRKFDITLPYVGYVNFTYDPKPRPPMMPFSLHFPIVLQFSGGPVLPDCTIFLDKTTSPGSAGFRCTVEKSLHNTTRHWEQRDWIDVDYEVALPLTEQKAVVLKWRRGKQDLLSIAIVDSPTERSQPTIESDTSVSNTETESGGSTD